MVTKEEPLTQGEILNMLSFVEDINELLSRANVWKKVNLGDMCVKSELIPFIQQNPRALGFPIVERKYDIMSGYSPEDYDRFLPREVRKKRFAELLRAANLDL